MIKKYGIIHLIKKGLDVDDANFTLFYQLPLASSSKQVKDNFEQNIFSVTRQVNYSLDNPEGKSFSWLSPGTQFSTQ